jgi:hypothetical protein
MLQRYACRQRVLKNLDPQARSWKPLGEECSFEHRSVHTQVVAEQKKDANSMCCTLVPLHAMLHVYRKLSTHCSYVSQYHHSRTIFMFLDLYLRSLARAVRTAGWSTLLLSHNSCCPRCESGCSTHAGGDTPAGIQCGVLILSCVASLRTASRQQLTGMLDSVLQSPSASVSGHHAAATTRDHSLGTVFCCCVRCNSFVQTQPLLSLYYYTICIVSTALLHHAQQITLHQVSYHCYSLQRTDQCTMLKWQ